MYDLLPASGRWSKPCKHEAGAVGSVEQRRRYSLASEGLEQVLICEFQLIAKLREVFVFIEARQLITVSFVEW